MKLIILVLLGSFLLIEAAHLNYHYQSEVNGRSTVEF